MARHQLRRQHYHYFSILTTGIKRLLSVSLMMLLTACSHMTLNQPAKPINEAVPVTAAMQKLVAVCSQSPSEVVINNAPINEFIADYCSTNSTTKQLKLIKTIKVQSTWPSEYQVWFDTLTWHTENLRRQKITNYYSDSKAQKHQQQLLELQKQLIELKQKLVDIEKQRLETSLSEDIEL